MMALTIALGGTSYAAIKLPANSVGSKQIKASAVRSSELGGGPGDVGEGQDWIAARAGLQGRPAAGRRDGRQRRDWRDRRAGDTGIQGPAGTIGAVVARAATATADMTNNQKASYDVYCSAGEQALGGGGRGDDNHSELTRVTSSRPAVSATNPEPPANGAGFAGWRITVQNVGNNPNIRPTASVMCAAAPTPTPA